MWGVFFFEVAHLKVGLNGNQKENNPFLGPNIESGRKEVWGPPILTPTFVYRNWAAKPPDAAGAKARHAADADDSGGYRDGYAFGAVSSRGICEGVCSPVRVRSRGGCYHRGMCKAGFLSHSL